MLGREVVLNQDLDLGTTGAKKPEHGRCRHTRPGNHGLAEGARGIRSDARNDLGHWQSVPDLALAEYRRKLGAALRLA